MSIKLFAQCVLFSITGIVSATTAFAIPTYMYDGGGTVVTGVNEIDIGGTLWDVAFIDDSVLDYLAATGLSGPQFTGPEALDMTSALALALNNDLPDMSASDFNGCTTTTTDSCFITTLYAITDPNSFGIRTTVDGSHTYPTGAIEITLNDFNNPNLTLTYWTEHVSGAPEPTLLALLSAGLLGFTGWARRRL